LVAVFGAGLSACDTPRYREVAKTEATNGDAPARLGLNLVRRGVEFKLTWDRTALAVRNARGATLRISERSQDRQFRLRPAELESGEFLYRAPAVEDMRFQLWVSGDAGPVTESIRFLTGQDLEGQALSTPKPTGADADSGGAEPGGPAVTVIPPEQASEAVQTMRLALADRKYPFRTIRRLAVLAGVSEDSAMELLRGQPDVIFGTSSGRRIARLASR
jgi:hypothetical protein